MTRKTRDSGGPAAGAGTTSTDARRELIVVARQGVGLRARGQVVAAPHGTDARRLARLLTKEHAAMFPLFGASEERVMRAARLSAGALVREMPRYYRVHAPDERLQALAAMLGQNALVDGAYVKAPCAPAAPADYVLPLATEPPTVTPDFSSRQGYLGPAPGGIHARFAWTRPGGTGAGVGIIDIEGAWRFSHEDLGQSQGGVVGGTPSTSLFWRNHGTAVLGQIGGDDNGIGVRGICPAASFRGISAIDLGSAQAISLAAKHSSVGDLVLVEMHRPGPRYGHVARPDARGYIAIEWWPDDFLAVQYATGLGVLVVQVAGNGAEDLDDGILDQPAPGFPETWVNPFRRVQDSLAILVGAGAPPPGTHGHAFGPDRSRLGFSNFGSCVDAQGWGREITTCGYGDLQGGSDEDLWYTDKFGGTSGAAAMVVGALGSLQGALRGAGRPQLTPATARELLRTTGSLQRSAPARPASQRIGNRPDLRQALVRLGIGGTLVKGKTSTRPVGSRKKASR